MYMIVIFCDWLLSLSLFSEFICVVGGISISFLFLAKYTHSIVQILYVLLICSSIHGHLDCVQVLTVMNNAAVKIHIQVFVRHMFSFLLGIYLEVELLGHMVAHMFNYLLINLYWIVWGTTRLFSKAAPWLYTPTSSVWGYQFLHILDNTCYYLTVWF